MRTISYGPKYEETKGLTRVEVAKRIRADIKAAIVSGELPKGTYSVTCSRGTGIEITFAVPTILLYNAARLAWDMENPHAGHWSCPEEAREIYSVEARRIIAVLERFHADYNYDGSDISTDYFNVRYYGSARPAWQWGSARREMEEARIREGASPGPAKAAGEPQMVEQEEWLKRMGA